VKAYADIPQCADFFLSGCEGLHNKRLNSLNRRGGPVGTLNECLIYRCTYYVTEGNPLETNRIEMKSAGSQLPIAIVGGGFTGAVVAAQLLRKSRGSVSVVLIEKGARLGFGVA